MFNEPLVKSMNSFRYKGVIVFCVRVHSQCFLCVFTWVGFCLYLCV